VNRLDELRDKVLPLLAPYGVRRLAVFGSVARGEDHPGSDVDLLVDFTSPRLRPLGLIGWVRLERDLTDALGQRVEMVSSEGLSRNLRPLIEKDLVVLYEAP